MNALSLVNVGKKYKVDRVRDESIRNLWSNFFLLKKNKTKDFWALRDISFDVKQGDSIGIIGNNGAGKSTLLKLLSKITHPTEGSITIYGRASSLLEIGTGFHPELTGRENIFLNGCILGMKKREIKRRLEEIIEFSGVKKFVDIPVKHYSSGMYLRLAFSVAAHLDSELLFIDEVLAVGDTKFQQKCIQRMDADSKKGKTLLFVSHNLGAIRQMCQKTICLHEGKISFIGPTHQAINNYAKISYAGYQNISFEGPLGDNFQLEDIQLNGKSLFKQHAYISQVEEKVFTLIIQARSPLQTLKVTLSFVSQGTRLFSLHDSKEPIPCEKGRFKSVYQIPNTVLRPGIYFLNVGGLEKGRYSNWFSKLNVASFSVTEVWNQYLDPHNDGFINIAAKTFRINLT